MHRLNEACVALIHQDSFYRPLTPEEIANVKSYNFDHPDAFDNEALLKGLANLSAGRSIEVPVYDFTRHARSEEVRKVDPADVVIVEGILVLHVPELRDMLNMKIYVDTDDDMRLGRRIQRDVQERGRDVAGVIAQYMSFVKPAFDQFVAPSRRYADVIIPWQRGDNIVAIDLITQHIRTKLQQHSLKRLYPNLEVIPSNYQIRGMHTIIRDAATSKNDFVFYADRLNRLVVEAGLGLLPFAEKTVATPTGHAYVGVDFARKLCGVSIIRSGESMEAALRTCCKGIKIGKILVVRHHGQPISGPTSGMNTPSVCTSPLLLAPSQQQQQQAAGGGSSAVVSPRAAAQDSSSSRGSPRGVAGNPSGGYSPIPGGPATPGAPNAGSSRSSSKPPPAAAGGSSGSIQRSPPNSSRDREATTPPNSSRQGAASAFKLGRSTDGAAYAAATAAFGGMSLSSLNAAHDVIYEKLPADIAQRYVMLMDPVLSTGNSACRAIEVLLNRGVEEEKIFLLSIIAAPEGISRVCGRFPAVRVVTSEIDSCVDDKFAVVPGCGEFGDRYFCD